MMKGPADLNATCSELEAKFQARYDDAFHWIRTQLLSGNRQGIINLIFWRLPLLFIEGKVIAFFFQHSNFKDPLVDSIWIPDGQSLFTYKAFCDSLETYKWKDVTEEYLTLTRKPTGESKFDFLDYFGFPCVDENEEPERRYRCQKYEICPCFEGKMEIWIAANCDKKDFDENRREVFFNQSFHEERLKELSDRIQEVREKYLGGKQSGELVGYFPERQLGTKVQLSDYMRSAFENLHHALIQLLDWSDNPCRLFIVINSELYSPKMVLFLTESQKDKYKTMLTGKSSETTDLMRTVKGELCSAVRNEISQNETALNELKKTTKKKIQGGLELDVDEFLEASYWLLQNIPQSYTVSSFFKQRGFYELFLEGKTEFTKHPIICKGKSIKSSMKNYSYPEILAGIEPLFLIDLPNINSHKAEEKKNNNYEFAMIPFFYRGAPFGCIAFFNPKVLDKDEWYYYLNKVFALLGKREDTIYEASVKDLCGNILRMLEGVQDGG